MRKSDTEESSLLADFFSNASPETRRKVFREVLHKASASQREVLERAAKIRCSLGSADSGNNKNLSA